jgi:threonine synthase
MAEHYQLKCRECGKLWGNEPRSFCDECLSPVEITYDLDAIRGIFTRKNIEAGPTNLWRYSGLLPLPEGFQGTLPTGFTPLLEARHLSKQLGAKKLYVKNDAVCFPTLPSRIAWWRWRWRRRAGLGSRW